MANKVAAVERTTPPKAMRLRLSASYWPCFSAIFCLNSNKQIQVVNDDCQPPSTFYTPGQTVQSRCKGNHNFFGFQRPPNQAIRSYLQKSKKRFQTGTRTVRRLCLFRKNRPELNALQRRPPKLLLELLGKHERAHRLRRAQRLFMSNAKMFMIEVIVEYNVLYNCFFVVNDQNVCFFAEILWILWLLLQLIRRSEWYFGYIDKV